MTCGSANPKDYVNFMNDNKMGNIRNSQLKCHIEVIIFYLILFTISKNNRKNNFF